MSEENNIITLVRRLADGSDARSTAAEARALAQCPPISHASANTTYGVAGSGIYGHVIASNIIPLAATTTGSIGTTYAMFALADHNHPIQDSIPGLAVLATRLETPRRFAIGGAACADGIEFDGSNDVILNLKHIDPDYLDYAVPIDKGGTGATTAALALAALGAAPISHAIAGSTYGLATDALYGHAMASTTLPVDASTNAALGNEINKFARGDHNHKAQTSVTGNAGSATKLETARSIAITGGATAASKNFDGSANISLDVTALDPSKLSSVVPIAKGGTGLSAIGADGTVIISNGTANLYRKLEINDISGLSNSLNGEIKKSAYFTCSTGKTIGAKTVGSTSVAYTPVAGDAVYILFEEAGTADDTAVTLKVNNSNYYPIANGVVQLTCKDIPFGLYQFVFDGTQWKTVSEHAYSIVFKTVDSNQIQIVGTTTSVVTNAPEHPVITPDIYYDTDLNSATYGLHAPMFNGAGTLLTALNADNIASGKIGIARIPTGTTATSVALGNHQHDNYLAKTGGQMSNTITFASTVQPLLHKDGASGVALFVSGDMVIRNLIENDIPSRFTKIKTLRDVDGDISSSEGSPTQMTSTHHTAGKDTTLHIVIGGTSGITENFTRYINLPALGTVALEGDKIEMIITNVNSSYIGSVRFNPSTSSATFRTMNGSYILANDRIFASGEKCTFYAIKETTSGALTWRVVKNSENVF